VIEVIKVKRTIIWGLLLLLIGVATLSAQTKTEYQKMYVRTEKNPGEAFLLSLIIPGAGQMYNGDVAIGLGVFFGTGTIFVGGMLLGSETEAFYYIGSIGGGVVYLAQLIHAPIRAKQISDRYWTGQAPLLRYKGKEFSLALNPVQKKGGLVVKF
jgi:TM2 domain-containing membrane protein YozV